MPRSLSKYFVRQAGLADRPHGGASGGSARDAKVEYIELRRREAETRNARLAKRVRGLETILVVGIERDPRVFLDGLPPRPDLADPPDDTGPAPRPERASFDPPPLGLAAFLPGARQRRAEAVDAAEARFQAATAEWERRSAERNAAIEAARAEARARAARIESLKAALAAGDPDAVEAHAERVLAESPYPDTFHHEVKINFAPETHDYVVDIQAPVLAEIVPRVERFEYQKAKDKIVALAKPEEGRRKLYDSVIAQLALRTLHEVFSTDTGHHIETIVMNVYMVSTDPGTGKSVRPTIVSARVSRTEFDDLELAAVEPVACLERLMGRSGAEFARDPGSS